MFACYGHCCIPCADNVTGHMCSTINSSMIFVVNYYVMFFQLKTKIDLVLLVPRIDILSG